MSDSDPEHGIGVGRRASPSSSRESTPLHRHKRKRSYTPPSEDGDFGQARTLVEDAATTRPLLRQPVGFEWKSTSVLGSTSLETYDAPPNTTSQSTHYLPGQEIPGSRRSRTGRSRRLQGESQRPRKNRHFSSQTNRFRLQSTPPTVSLQLDATPTPLLAVNLTPQLAMPLTSLGPSGPTVNTMTVPPAAVANKLPKAMKPNKTSTTSATASRSTGSKKQATQRAVAGPSQSRRHTPTEPAVLSQQPNSRNHQDSKSNAHYRRDYEQTKNLQATQAAPSHAALVLDNLAAAQTQQQGQAPNTARLRMVTVLIHDVRSGATDYQLTEVKISLKAADDPQDGFWADSEELCNKIQSSPSRIDGPAKVYTLRGKYRQIILRVSNDNEDQYMAANVMVTPERTLDLIVEALPPIGIIPHPPRLLHHHAQSSPELDESSISSHQSYPQPIIQSRKRARSPSYSTSEVSHLNHIRRSASSRHREQSTSSFSTRTQSSIPSPAYASSIATLSPSRKQSRHSTGAEHRSLYEDEDYDGTASSAESNGFSRNPSPTSGVDQQSIDQIIQEHICDELQAKPDYVSYTSGQPVTIPRLLAHYRFFESMTREFSGQFVPGVHSQHKIETRHILGAMGIINPSYPDKCREMLALVDIYGPNGSRADPQVTQMCRDQDGSDERNIQHDKLMRLMRELDQQG